MTDNAAMIGIAGGLKFAAQSTDMQIFTSPAHFSALDREPNLSF
jgi:tRNA A37 threonylcarbamoyltransferase TsaD